MNSKYFSCTIFQVSEHKIYMSKFNSLIDACILSISSHTQRSYIYCLAVRTECLLESSRFQWKSLYNSIFCSIRLETLQWKGLVPFYVSLFCECIYINCVHVLGNLLGLHSTHGSYNIPNMASTYASRNSAGNGGPSSGVQQAAGSIGNGRFTMNNLPASLSQVLLVFYDANKFTNMQIWADLHSHKPILWQQKHKHTNITL